jgi:hypothetical protein
MKMSSPVQGAPDLDKIRKHVLKALGALVHVEHFYKGGEALASAKSRVFYSAVSW